MAPLRNIILSAMVFTGVFSVAYAQSPVEMIPLIVHKCFTERDDIQRNVRFECVADYTLCLYIKYCDWDLTSYFRAYISSIIRNEIEQGYNVNSKQFKDAVLRECPKFEEILSEEFEIALKRSAANTRIQQNLSENKNANKMETSKTNMGSLDDLAKKLKLNGYAGEALSFVSDCSTGNSDPMSRRNFLFTNRHKLNVLFKEDFLILFTDDRSLMFALTREKGKYYDHSYQPEYLQLLDLGAYSSSRILIFAEILNPLNN
jgi:hypothetical protein